MYAFIGKIIVGIVLVGLCLNYTTLGGWSLCAFLVPFLVGGD